MHYDDIVRLGPGDKALCLLCYAHSHRSLDDNAIDVTHVELLAFGLRTNTALQHLRLFPVSEPRISHCSLNRNAIGNSGLDLLVTGLRTNTDTALATLRLVDVSSLSSLKNWPT